MPGRPSGFDRLLFESLGMPLVRIGTWCALQQELCGRQPFRVRYKSMGLVTGEIMGQLSAVIVALMASTGAFAASNNQTGQAKTGRPAVGPPPAWVIDAPDAQPPSAAEGASTIDLLSDTQTRLSADGDSSFFETIYKIANANGLGDGSLQLSWDPSLENLTIHRYRILRGGKSIDLLGDGSKLTVVQRETNMENATLDGRLTASLQPEDLRVGDVIDLAYTRVRRDPAMGGRSEFLVGPRDGNPYGHLRIRVLWPSDKKIVWRTFPGSVQPQLHHTKAGSELIAELTNATPPEPPQGAPSRYRVVNAVEGSEFASWGVVARAFLPHFVAAEKLAPDSPVRAEAARIAAQSTDPRRRAELALTLVQEKIRYLFLGMDDGGYVPASADVTWSRRFGDCKAKTVLLVALLNQLGIDARPVLVNTDQGDFVASRLPIMGAFNHAIVEARIGHKSYWMDGTRLGDEHLELLRTPSFQVGLPISNEASGLVTLTPEPLTSPSETTTLALDASQGVDAPAAAIGEMRFRGESGTDMRVKYAAFSVVDRTEELRKLWRKTYDFVSPTSVGMHVDGPTGDFVLTMSGTAKMEWSEDAGARWYAVDRARIGWKFDTVRDGTLAKDAPFAFDYPDYWESRETIKLPAKGAGFRLQGGSVDQTIGGLYAFHRKVTLEGETVTMESSTRALASELPANKAEQTRSEMAALAATGIFVRVPDDYLATSADLAALKDNRPALAKALLRRGAFLFDKGDVTASLADEDAAIAIDPNAATAHAIRALALASKGDARADAAADRAIALDPKQLLASRAKAVWALTQRRYDDAKKAFSAELVLNAKDENSLAGRASVNLLLGRGAEALADVDAALELVPGLKVHILRATALEELGRDNEALVEADRALAQQDEPNIRLARAELRSQAGDRTGALADFEVLLRQTPKPSYYLKRAAVWAPSERMKRDLDIESALALEPKSIDALSAHALASIQESKVSSAEADIATIARIKPDAAVLDRLRVQLLQKEGRPRDALAILDADVVKSPANSTLLNERCWLKATLNIEITSALADCEEALKHSPGNPAILDSRAFVRLRTGAVEGALADYNLALKASPHMAASLYGRALAHARRGELGPAEADLAEARRVSPEIDERFAEYGMRFADLRTAPPNPAPASH